MNDDDKCQQSKTKTNKKIYVDAAGTNWYFLDTAKNAQKLTKLLKTIGLLKAGSYQKCRKNTVVRYRCRKKRTSCEFKGIFLRKNCAFYIRNEHNHPLVAFGGNFFLKKH